LTSEALKPQPQVSTKLSGVSNDVAKILEAVKDLSKRTDYHAGKLVSSHKQLHETVRSKFEDQLSEAAASSPFLYLLCSQLPWVCTPPTKGS